ncbi:MAG: BACON domain-containing protein, partial [bacterium]|nr:BACON domain-containing protein [bacterium]
FDTALSPVDANANMTTELPDSLKETPDIALSPWGGGMLVWADYRNRNWDIYGQMIASDGALVGSNFKVNSDAGTAQQHAPRVAVSPEGWFAVTWYDNRRGNDDIYVQRYDSLANALGGNLKANADVGDVRQAFPDIATDGAGHFTVVWVDWRQGTYPDNPDIYARKFDTNLAPVTGDMRVNKDGTTRAQRQPSIAADRRGNVAIIWADSTGSSWDIVGQMIDVEGVIREANFQANTEGDSSQLHPDVALDGRYRYITWSDKRNGNFDIYASIAKYNDPTLVPSPSSLLFEMLEGDAVPPSQDLEIDHAGYNPIHFQVISSADWLSASPTSGVTLGTVSVSVTTDTLP